MCFELRRPLRAAVNSNASIFELHCGCMHALLTQDYEPETPMWIFQKNIFIRRFPRLMFSVYSMCFRENSAFSTCFFRIRCKLVNTLSSIYSGSVIEIKISFARGTWEQIYEITTGQFCHIKTTTTYTDTLIKTIAKNLWKISVSRTLKSLRGTSVSNFNLFCSSFQ